jgi:hypothetical protein
MVALVIPGPLPSIAYSSESTRVLESRSCFYISLARVQEAFDLLCDNRCTMC